MSSSISGSTLVVDAAKESGRKEFVAIADRFFQGMTVLEALSFDEDTWASTVKSEPGFVLQTRLMRRTLKAMLEEHAPRASLPVGSVAQVLNLRGRVIGKALHRARPDLRTVGELCSVLPAEQLGQVKRIDLQDCTLLDDDLPDVVELANRATKCEVLNLSANRIGLGGPTRELADALTRLLAVTHLRFVVVLHNDLGAITCKDVVANLLPHHLAKLIFVPSVWLEAKTWHVMVQPEQAGAVKRAHETYYATTIE